MSIESDFDFDPPERFDVRKAKNLTDPILHPAHQWDASDIRQAIALLESAVVMAEEFEELKKGILELRLRK